MHLCHTESKLLFHETPLLSIIMQVRLVCLSYVLLFCTCIDTYIYMHMYKWKALLALTIVDVAFFILHDYYNYESLVFFGLLLLPSINLQKTLCKHIHLEVVDGVAIWTFLTHLSFSFARAKKKTFVDYVYRVEKRRHFHFSWGKKGRISIESFFLYLLAHILKKVIIFYYCHTMHNAPWRCLMFCHFFYNQSSFSSISKTKNSM
jgi:hypothetical protein